MPFSPISGSKARAACTTPGGRFSGRLIWKDDCEKTGGLSLSSSTEHSTVAMPERGLGPLSRAWTEDRNPHRQNESPLLSDTFSLCLHFLSTYSIFFSLDNIQHHSGALWCHSAFSGCAFHYRISCQLKYWDTLPIVSFRYFFRSNSTAVTFWHIPSLSERFPPHIWVFFSDTRWNLLLACHYTNLSSLFLYFIIISNVAEN